MRSGHTHFMFSNPWCAWCAPILSGIPCLLSVNLRPSRLFPHIPLIWPTPARPHAQVRHIYFPSLNFSHNVSDLVWPLVTHPTITSHHFWDLTGLASSHLLCETQNFEPDVQHTRIVYCRTQERYIEQWLWPGLVIVVYISLTLILVQKCQISCKLDQVYCAWLIKWIIQREIIQLCLTRWWIISDTSRYWVSIRRYWLVLGGTGSV